MIVDQNVKLLVGTEEGEILEIVTQQEKEIKEDSVNMDIGSAAGVTASVLMRSHSQGTHSMAQGEVWGLAVCPSNPDWVVTGADDGKCVCVCLVCLVLCVWSCVLHFSHQKFSSNH